jgi:hypothetical protein
MKTLDGYKGHLALACQTIVFLMTAFGGFLAAAAPPTSRLQNFSVGLVSLLLLALLLATRSLGRINVSKRRQRWLIGGLAAFVITIPAAILYPKYLSESTFWYPEEHPSLRIRGTEKELSEKVRIFLARNPGESMAPENLARNFEIDDIWNAEAISGVGTRLLVMYMWLTLGLGTSLFCFIESLGDGSTSRRGSAQ